MKYALCILFLTVFSCQSDEFSEQDYIDATYELDEENLVSHLSIEGYTADKAFGRGIPGLSDLELSFFGIGNAMFDQSWVSSPATTTSRDGLGPIFNARACSGCHLRDGRGKPLLENGADSEGFLIRLSHGNNQITGPISLFNYGGQLQDDANLGINNEGQIQVDFKIITGEYPDGTTYELRAPKYSIVNENYGSLGNVEQSPRVGQQVIGLGFIDALSEASILANEDINDADGDGISGKANYVFNVKQNKNTIGKFGWKANQPTLEQQVAGALHGDMGLTTSIFPDENCPDGIDCSTLYNGVNDGDTVEVPDEQFSRLMLYQAAISVPKRRDFKNADVLKGKELFSDLACVSCHVNNFTTSEYPLLPQIDDVKIRPYSDFLLHDMGDALADNRSDFLANGNEWRTQPLWGLGMIELVNGHTFLLHDGRARTIEEAILWHGGEAEQSKKDFINLSKEERQQILSFLNSL
ncbi:di-heme oxidoredictase family protein [Tamlana sp. 2_MG-2023]|uniref:di-heme oxidoreductase family protein n=1 Tax=unclassified Tamlana TaxID=2614803 RepID=UPI0026E33DE6|nr:MULTISPECIES: di-heme oxidoredictase family protein [unclassified Tamlana]MDO6759311.1 di-heme oxidoredictase family protein [Tamlana sp. 2_MG-2023]MDO6790550.1 di-heme oxidoredictase family protein [Tamlana sp. 1_MG-2023]